MSYTYSDLILHTVFKYNKLRAKAGIGQHFNGQPNSKNPFGSFGCRSYRN